MTTEQTASEALASGTDPVSEAQNQLDTPQQQPAEPQFITREQLDAALSERTSSLTSEIRGLQSVIDRQTNLIGELSTAQRNAQVEDYASRLPEEDRESFREWAQQNQSQLQNGYAQQPSRPQIDEGTANFVRQAGVDPNDPRMDYTALFDTSLNEYQRASALMQAIEKAKQTSAPQTPAQPPQPAQAPQPEPQVVSPSPSDQPRGNAPQGYNSDEDYHKAYLRRDITLQERNEGLERLKRAEWNQT